MPKQHITLKLQGHACSKVILVVRYEVHGHLGLAQ